MTEELTFRLKLDTEELRSVISDMVKDAELFTIDDLGVWHSKPGAELPFTPLDRPAVLALARRLQLSTVPKWTRAPDAVLDDGRMVICRWELPDACYIDVWTKDFETWHTMQRICSPETIDAAVVELLKEAP